MHKTRIVYNLQVPLSTFFFWQSNRYQQMSSEPKFQRFNIMLSNVLGLEHFSYFGTSFETSSNSVPK